MGKEATKHPFTAAQEDRIASFYKAFEAIVWKHDPKLKGNNAKVNAWRKEIASQLIQEDLFKDLDFTASKKNDWKAVSINLTFAVSFDLTSSYFRPSDASSPTTSVMR